MVQSIVRQTPTNEKITSGTDPVFRVTFSDDVRNVTADDFLLTSTAGGSINAVSQVSASTYDVTITGLTNSDGTITLNIKGVDGTAGTNDITEDIDSSFVNGTAAHTQTTANDYLNQALLGQSFQATNNNFLTAFTIFPKSGNHTFSGTARLRVFQGDASATTVLNDANAVLFEGTVNVSDNTDGVGQTITVATPPQLSLGTTYSIVLDNFTGTGSHALQSHTSGSLPNGRAFFTGSNNSSHAAFDFQISIFEGIKITAAALLTTAPTTNQSYSVQAIDQTIAFGATSSNGAESTSQANLQVALSAAEGLDVTVDYAVTGTATGNGTDYTLANGTITITAGNTTNNITIASIIDDALAESDETVIVTLSNPGNATLGTNTVHTYTINDNDNVAPVASNVTFSGTLEVGQILTGAYTYTDNENDAESGTAFKWFISDDNTGTNKFVHLKWNLGTTNDVKIVNQDDLSVISYTSPVNSVFKGHILVPNPVPTNGIEVQVNFLSYGPNLFKELIPEEDINFVRLDIDLIDVGTEINQMKMLQISERLLVKIEAINNAMNNSVTPTLTINQTVTNTFDDGTLQNQEAILVILKRLLSKVSAAREALKKD